MARILLLTLVFSPDGVSTAVLMTELAQDLQALGHRVTVLTTTPHYNVEPEARAEQPLKRRWGGLLYESTCRDIPVYHAAMPRKDSRVEGRLLDYIRFHAISTLAGLTVAGGYDVILAPSPPLTIGLSAWFLGLARRAPFVYNVQEIYPDLAVSLGLLRNRLLIRSMEWLERFVYARARAVVVISEWFLRRLLAKGVPADNLIVIPNFVDTEFLDLGKRENDFATAYELAGQFVVLYAGNLGLAQSLETLIAASQRLTHLPDLRFLIVGDGARRAWLEAQIAQRKLANVTLLPYQPRSVVPQIYASSDVCLVPLKKGTAQETLPSKIYTIMAAARPVLVSADPDSELTWIVKEADCGWSVPPDDAEALASVTADAYHHRAELHRKGKNGRDFVLARHSRRAVVQQYHHLIQRIV